MKMKDNLSFKEQIEVLADFILKEYPDEIKNGGAIETAIQILEKQKSLVPSEEKV